MTCAHPVASLAATTDTIMNCPAEGWPDEQVVAIRCGVCRKVVARTTEGVVEILLGHVQRLSAEVEELKARG